MASRTPRGQRARNLAASTLALALALSGLSLATGSTVPAEAAPAPAFDCTVPRFFAQTEDPVGTVKLNTGSYDTTGASVWTALGAAQSSVLYNAVAFNPVDEYLYGTRYSGSDGQFVRIDRSGTITQLGASSTALGTAPNTLWDSGEFDSAGTYYVASGNQGTTRIYKITGLSTTTGTGGTRPARSEVALTASARIADFTFKDDMLWAPNYGQSGTIYRIDVNDVMGQGAGRVTAFTVPDTVIPVSSYGSAFTLTNGNLAFIGTNGYMYQVSVTNPRSATPTFELVSRVVAPANQRSNATNCSTALASSLAITKTGPATVVVGGRITWEVTVTNEGPGITSGFVLTDVLPTGLSGVSVQSDDTACVVNAAKTQATCNGGRLEVDETATVHVTATAPTTVGPIVNRATVVGNEDPSPPDPAESHSEVVVATTVDNATTLTDAVATSWNPVSERGGVVARDGSVFTYTPPSGYSGFDSFTYTVPGGTVTVRVQVSPLAEPEALETTVDVPVSIPVSDLVALGSGTDLTLDSVGSPVNGSVSVVGAEVVFTPAPGFSGAAKYTYTLRDPDGLTVSATVTVTVHNVFTPGSAADGIVTPHNTARTISLAQLATASGAALSPGGVSIESAPTRGSASVDAGTGAVTYTPDAGYAGSDSFSVEVCDVNGECTIVTIGVTVQPNTVTANADADGTDAGVAVIVDVRSNDISASNQSLAAPTIVTQPDHGAAVVRADGRITYTPAPGFSGGDEFEYRVCDTSTPTPVCDTSIVTIDVDNVFTPGAAVVDGVTTPHRTPAEIPLDDIVTTEGLPVDPDGITVTDGPTRGTVEVDPVTGAVTYTPTGGYAGDDGFELVLCDANAECITVSIEVTVSPNTVTAQADGGITAFGAPLELLVTANDSTASGQALSDPVVLTQPTNGSAAAGGDGNIVYTPDAGFSGEDSYSYRVCDTSTPTPVCATATVTITVANAFTPGSAVVDGVVTPHNTDARIPLADILTAAGAALDPATVAETSAPTDGSVSIDSVSGEVSYAPDAGYAGSDSFSVEVCDVEGECTTVVIGVTVQPNTVTATDDTASTDAGAAVEFAVTDDDVSASGQALAHPTVTQPANGTATVGSDGRITYTPDAGFSGEDELEYSVCDTSHPTPACDTATVVITVANVFADGPAARDGVATPHNQPVTIDLDDLVTTLGLPILPSAIVVTAPAADGTTTVDAVTGEVTYTPDTGYAGDDAFELRLCDANDECVDVTIDVEVSANSVAAGDDSEATDVDTVAHVDVRDNDTTASGQPLALPTVISGPVHGGTSVGADGLLTYTPDVGFSGEDTFDYRVCDTSHPTPECDTAMVTITVRNVFDDGALLLAGVGETPQDQPLTIPLGDIVVPRGASLDPSTVVVTIDTAMGRLVYDPLVGEFSYTPDDAYSGADEFVFRICDTSVPSQCTDVVVPLEVGVNVVTAVDDTLRTLFGQAIVIDVDANDTSATGRPLGDPVIVTQPRDGDAVVLADGRIRYTPRAGFAGADTFSYTRCDDSRPTPVCDTAVVNVTVASPALPLTGLDVALAGALALLLVLVGAIGVVWTRRRDA